MGSVPEPFGVRCEALVQPDVAPVTQCDRVAVPLVGPLMDVGQLVDGRAWVNVKDRPVLGFQGVSDVGILHHDPGTVEGIRPELTLLGADDLGDECAGGRLSAELRLDKAPYRELASSR